MPDKCKYPFQWQRPQEYFDPFHTALAVIERGAFAGLTNVDEIIIPDSVTSIAADAFEGSSVTLIVTSGSYAETWAIDHGMDHSVR